MIGGLKGSASGFGSKVQSPLLAQLIFLTDLLSILSPCALPLVRIVLGAAVSEHRFGAGRVIGGTLGPLRRGRAVRPAPRVLHRNWVFFLAAGGGAGRGGATPAGGHAVVRPSGRFSAVPQRPAAPGADG